MTDEAMPTEPDWQRLWERSETNRTRSRRALGVSVIGLALVVALLVGGGAIYLRQRDVPKVLDNQAKVLSKINEIVVGLQAAEQQRASTAKGSNMALAVIVENLAAFAATPPAPNAGRLKAVDGLCATARQFRAAAGDMHPPPCPGL